MQPGIPHTDLGTAVRAALRESIISGELAPGDRLVETELAERFDVSRGPIRDALTELERSGLVEMRPRKGSFVRSLSAEDIREIYSLRTALEALALRLAAESGADTRAMREHLEALEGALDSGDAHGNIAESDMALHRSFIEASGHRRLREAWEALSDQTMLMMSTLPTLDPSIQGPMGVHRAIVEAIEAGDPDGAVAALHQHLDDARHVMVSLFP